MFLTSWIKYSDIPQSTSWKQSNCIQVISSLQLSFNIKIISTQNTDENYLVTLSLGSIWVLYYLNLSGKKDQGYSQILPLNFTEAPSELRPPHDKR